MATRFSVDFLGSFKEEFDKVDETIAHAATAAVTEAADIAKTQGRADIASAGFSTRWQKALQANVYPTGRDSINAAGLIFHKIPYAGIHEEGATITGDPLWLPIQTNLPGASRKWTPARYRKEVGPLFFVNTSPRPLLLGRQRGAPTGKRGGQPPKVPMFVGIPEVTIRKKWNIVEIVKKAAAMLPALFAKNFEDDRS